MQMMRTDHLSVQVHKSSEGYQNAKNADPSAMLR